MRRAEIIGLPPPRTGAAALTGAIDSRVSLIDNTNMRSREQPSPHQVAHQSNDWPSVDRLVLGSVREWTDAGPGRAPSERARASPAAHAAVEIDGFAVGVDVRLAVSVWSVAMDHAPRTGATQPGLEPQRLPAKYASGGHPGDERFRVPGREEPADFVVDRADRVRFRRRNEGAELVAVAVLHERTVLEHQHGRAPPQPGLQRNVSCQLLEVVRLASCAEPGVDSSATLGPVAECRAHHDLVIAEEHGTVGTVSGVAQRTHAEGAPVHQVAEEDRVPAFG